jgi:hypothetical protein
MGFEPPGRRRKVMILALPLALVGAAFLAFVTLAAR